MVIKVPIGKQGNEWNQTYWDCIRHCIAYQLAKMYRLSLLAIKKKVYPIFYVKPVIYEIVGKDRFLER
jgi:hypothetical protein